MSFTKTFTTFLITVLVGSLSFLFTSPKKVIKGKKNPTKSNIQNGIEEGDSLFI